MYAYVWKENEGVMSRTLTVMLALAAIVAGHDMDRGEHLPPTIFVSLLARDKADTLPYTLTLLGDQDYSKERMRLYIRWHGESRDATVDIIKTWLEHHSHLYHSVDAQEDGSDVQDRFARIIQLKERALAEARRSWADFTFFLDADVFLWKNTTLSELVQHGQAKLITSPLLRSVGLYSNFWAGMSESYYYERTDQYMPILERKETDCFLVPMVHSAMLVNMKRKDSVDLTFNPNEIADYDGPYDDMIAFAISAEEMFLCNQKLYGHVMLPEGDGEPSLTNLLLEIAADHGPLNVHQSLETFLPPPPTKDKLDFDHVYLINLARRSDRLAKMDFCLRHLGVNYELTEAVDGKELTEEDLHRRQVSMLPGFEEPYHGRPLTMGEIGCFLSHYNIWRDVVKRDRRSVVVFEDDIRFQPFFRDKLKVLQGELATVLKGDWDLVFLGRKILSKEMEPWVEGSSMLVRPGYTYWTLAYLLSNRGARKLLNGQPLTKMVPVDEYLPIMYNRHPNTSWAAHFGPPSAEDALQAFSAAPLLVHPTHYTGEEGYISDTEDTATIQKPETKSFSNERGTIDMDGDDSVIVAHPAATESCSGQCKDEL